MCITKMLPSTDSKSSYLNDGNNTDNLNLLSTVINNIIKGQKIKIFRHFDDVQTEEREMQL